MQGKWLGEDASGSIAGANPKGRGVEGRGKMRWCIASSVVVTTQHATCMLSCLFAGVPQLLYAHQQFAQC